MSRRAARLFLGALAVGLALTAAARCHGDEPTTGPDTSVTAQTELADQSPANQPTDQAATPAQPESSPQNGAGFRVFTVPKPRHTAGAKPPEPPLQPSTGPAQSPPAVPLWHFSGQSVVAATREEADVWLNLDGDLGRGRVGSALRLSQSGSSVALEGGLVDYRIGPLQACVGEQTTDLFGLVRGARLGWADTHVDVGLAYLEDSPGSVAGFGHAVLLEGTAQPSQGLSTGAALASDGSYRLALTGETGGLFAFTSYQRLGFSGETGRALYLQSNLGDGWTCHARALLWSGAGEGRAQALGLHKPLKGALLSLEGMRLSSLPNRITDFAARLTWPRRSTLLSLAVGHRRERQASKLDEATSLSFRLHRTTSKRSQAWLGGSLSTGRSEGVSLGVRVRPNARWWTEARGYGMFASAEPVFEAAVGYQATDDLGLLLRYGPLYALREETYPTGPSGLTLSLTGAFDTARRQGGTIQGTVMAPDGSPVPGVTVLLDGGFAAVTSKAGQYVFKRVTPGTHTLSVNPLTLPANWAPAQQAYSLVMTARATVRCDLPLVALGLIEGHVFADLNRNGKRDGGEGVPGVLISLGQTTTITNDEGHYGFHNLREGTYEIRLSLETIPRGLQLLSVQSWRVRLAPGEAISEADFILQRPSRPVIMTTQHQQAAPGPAPVSAGPLLDGRG